jgi:hypothetical protein
MFTVVMKPVYVSSYNAMVVNEPMLGLTFQEKRMCKIRYTEQPFCNNFWDDLKEEFPRSYQKDISLPRRPTYLC